MHALLVLVISFKIYINRLAREEEIVVVPDGEEVDVDNLDDMITFDDSFEEVKLS